MTDSGRFCLFQEDLKKETLLKQFKIVRSHTNTSHVMQYGNKVRGNRRTLTNVQPSGRERCDTGATAPGTHAFNESQQRTDRHVLGCGLVALGGIGA